MQWNKRWITAAVLLVLSWAARGGNHAFWERTTAYGTVISHENIGDGYVFIISNSEQSRWHPEKDDEYLVGVDRWYFYRAHIMGEFTRRGRKGYFIFDELAGDYQTFADEEDYQHRLRAEGLQPRVWTRWYRTQWGFLRNEGDVSNRFSFAFIKIPLLVLLGLATLVGLIRTGFRLNHWFNRVTLALVVMVIIRYLLDVYPDSF